MSTATNTANSTNTTNTTNSTNILNRMVKKELFAIIKKSKTTSQDISDVLSLAPNLDINVVNSRNETLLEIMLKYINNYDLMIWLYDNNQYDTRILSKAFYNFVMARNPKNFEKTLQWFKSKQINFPIINSHPTGLYKKPSGCPDIHWLVSQIHIDSRFQYPIERNLFVLFLETMYDITTLDQNGNTYLHYIFSLDRFSMHNTYYITPGDQYYAFQKKVDINHLNNDGDSILHIWAKNAVSRTHFNKIFIDKLGQLSKLIKPEIVKIKNKLGQSAFDILAQSSATLIHNNNSPYNLVTDSFGLQ